MAALTMDQAEKIIAAARKRRAKLKEVPLAYAVVDSGGHLLAMAREEEAGFLRGQIAINKAWTCFAVGLPSSQISPPPGVMRPAMSCSSVVLPEPDGPSSVRNSPSSTASEVGFSATTSPYRFWTSLRRSLCFIDQARGARTGP